MPCSGKTKAGGPCGMRAPAGALCVNCRRRAAAAAPGVELHQARPGNTAARSDAGAELALLPDDPGDKAKKAAPAPLGPVAGGALGLALAAALAWFLRGGADVPAGGAK